MKYQTPMIEISTFDAENIVTESIVAGLTDQGVKAENVKQIEFDKIKNELKITF